MEQIELLWQYQQADMEAERFKSEFRASPTRVQMEKDREFIVEQQKLIRKIEGDVTVMADRTAAIEDEVRRLTDLLDALETRIADQPADDQEQTAKYLKEARKIMDTLTQYETEMKKIRRDAAQRDTQQHEVKRRAAKAKNEYERLRVAYEPEYQAALSKLEGLKKTIAERAKNVSPTYLQEYQQVKKHVSPPMARLNGDRCGGCNMNLPQAVLNDIRSGARIVECETCGRMIVLLPD